MFKLSKRSKILCMELSEISKSVFFSKNTAIGICPCMDISIRRKRNLFLITSDKYFLIVSPSGKLYPRKKKTQKINEVIKQAALDIINTIYCIIQALEFSKSKASLQFAKTHSWCMTSKSGIIFQTLNYTIKNLEKIFNLE